MSVTFCIKYALGNVTVQDVKRIFNGLFGEELVIQVTELVKDDIYNEKKFKIFFIECDKSKQSKGIDTLERNINQNATFGDKKGARVTIDSHGHFWKVVFGKIVKPKNFEPFIVDDTHARTTHMSRDVNPRAGKKFKSLCKDDQLFIQALRDTIEHFTELGLYPTPEEEE